MRLFKAVRGKKLLLCLALALAAALLVTYGKSPLQRRLHGVPGDVIYLDRQLTGLLEAEVEDIVRAGAEEFFLAPVDAREDPDWKDGVIPHIFGMQLKVEETAARIMEAGRGEMVLPVLERVEPRVTLDDFPLSPVYRGSSHKNGVALMINVAWGGEHLPAMLEVLAREEAKATFFLVGRWAEKNREAIQSILQGGHEIASHGYDDSIVLKGLSTADALEDLEKSMTAIASHTGEDILYVTPHKGEYDQASLEAARRLGLRMVLWSLDTADWLKPGVERMLERTVHKAFGGAIILLHPTEDSAAYLEQALPLLKEQGLAVVSVASLLDPEPVCPLTGGREP